MTNWKHIKLGNISEVIGGGTPSTKNYDFWNGNIPWLTPKDLSGYNNRYISRGERNITKLGLQNSSARMLPKGAVLLTSRAPIGYIAIAENDVCTNQGFKSIVLKDGYCPEFFYYLLRNNIDYIVGMGSGSTFAEISGTQVKNLEFTVPPLDIQKKIAGVLGALDDKIELNNRINNNLEQQAQALFKSWFVDFEPFGGKMPDDWKVGNLLDIADYLNGLAMQKFRPAENDKGLPVLKIKELRQGFCDSNSELCSLNVKNEYIVNDGDVIFSWSGSLLVDFWCGGKCGLNQHLFKVTSKNFDKWFYFLWTKHYLEHFAFIAADKATTMGHIKREELEKAKVIIPSSECYQKMKQIMTPIYDLLISNRVENTRLSALRDTLLPKLMSGEIDVSNVDISALTSTDKLSFTGV